MTAQERCSLLVELLTVVTVPVALALGIAGATEDRLQDMLDDAFDEYEALVGTPHPLDVEDDA